MDGYSSVKKCSYCFKFKEIKDFFKGNKEFKTCFSCRESKKEYFIKNIEAAHIRHKNYNIKNKKTLSEKAKIKRNNNKEYEKNRHQIYYQNNREIILDRCEEYRNNNVEKEKNRHIIYRLNNELKCILQDTKTRAKKINVENNLTLEYLMSIDRDYCPYFNFPFIKGGGFKERNFAKSIDRIDSSLGYILGNVEFISFRANFIKRDSTIDEQEKIVCWLEKNKIICSKLSIIEKSYDLNRLKQFFILKEKNSKKRGHQFEINFDYFLSILPEDGLCPIFSSKFVFSSKSIDEQLTIDRIDSTKGYIIGNVAAISRRANILKNNATLEELSFMVNRRKEMEKLRCQLQQF